MSTHTDEPRAVIERMIEAINRHDQEACVAFYSEDALLQDPRFPEPVTGRQYVEEGFDYWFKAFPDVRVTLEETIVEGPKVAIEWTFDATHGGEYMGIEPSGKRFKIRTAAHFEVRDGRVTRDFSLFDATGLRQLEALHDEEAGTAEQAATTSG